MSSFFQKNSSFGILQRLYQELLTRGTRFKVWFFKKLGVPKAWFSKKLGFPKILDSRIDAETQKRSTKTKRFQHRFFAVPVSFWKGLWQFFRSLNDCFSMPRERPPMSTKLQFLWFGRYFGIVAEHAYLGQFRWKIARLGCFRFWWHFAQVLEGIWEPQNFNFRNFPLKNRSKRIWWFLEG